MVVVAAVTAATSDIEGATYAAAAAAAAAPQKRSACWWWLGLAGLATIALLAVSAIAALSAEVRQLNIQLEAERSHSSRALQELNTTQCIPVATAFNGTRRLEVGISSARSMQLTADLMGGTKGILEQADSCYLFRAECNRAVAALYMHLHSGQCCSACCTYCHTSCALCLITMGFPPIGSFHFLFFRFAVSPQLTSRSCTSPWRQWLLAATISPTSLR
jgi:hypothetical protein